MTKEQIKEQIDLEITNKTATNSVTPIIVGDNMKSIVDLLPNLILHYEGDLNSTTIPQFSDGVMNVYRVTENFTYNTVVLKTGNIIGLTSTTIILIADNQKELLQNQLDAINSATSPSTSNPFVTQSVLGDYIKKINTTILPDVNGNAVIPIATETNDGLISFGGIQNLRGTKNIKMNGNSSNVTYGFLVTDSAGTTAFRIAENRDSNFLGQLISTGTFQLASGYMQISGAGTMGTIRKLGASLEFGQNTNQEKRLKINVDTGGTTIGANAGVDTNAMFEVISIANAKVSVPFPKMTNADRLLISGANLVEGGGVYVTDAGINKGLWIYEGATIGWKQYQKI